MSTAIQSRSPIRRNVRSTNVENITRIRQLHNTYNQAEARTEIARVLGSLYGNIEDFDVVHIDADDYEIHVDIRNRSSLILRAHKE